MPGIEKITLSRWLKGIGAALVLVLAAYLIKDARERYRSQRLFEAIASGNASAVRINYPKPEPIFDKKGVSPLNNALLDSNREMVAYFLSIGVDPKKIDELGFSPVHLATRDAECLRLLINHGVDVESRDRVTGFTPLLIASASKKTSETSKVLLEAGANPNANVNIERLSPLIRAAQAGNIESVRLLLQYGANIDLKDAHDKTAADYAREIGRQDIIDLLQSKSTEPKQSAK